MRIILLSLAGTLALTVTAASPAAAQVMVDVPIWSNGILGQQALRNTYDNFNEANGIDDDGDQRAGPGSRECSADALPAEDRRQMEADYVRRVRADGKASADAWVREQGRQFRLKLVAAGICPDPAEEAQITRNEQDGTGEDGCRMVMRPVAGLGGAPMTMAMVPECD